MAYQPQVIHSGHFMTSNPHNEDVTAEDDEDIEVDVVEDDEKPEESSSGTGIKNKALEEKPVTFYKFGPKKTQSIAIDVSLNKLNKCIKVAYNKMTTPKWKDFKGLRLHWKQRIRLNNVIWRAYHIEFRKKTMVRSKKKTPFCYFAVPDDDTTHQKIEGSLLEGMYWKRKMEAVCAQYKRWRMRSRHNQSHEKTSTSSGSKRKRIPSAGAAIPMKTSEPPTKVQRSQTPKFSFGSDFWDVDDFDNVFTDELFESLSQPYAFPNPKEMLQSGNADIMQPGLLPLQPSLEEIMASLGDFPDPPTPTTGHMRMSEDSMSPPLQPPSREHMTQSSSNHSIQSLNECSDPQSQSTRSGDVATMSQQPIQSSTLQRATSSSALLRHMADTQQQQQQPHSSQMQLMRPTQQDYAAASMLVDYSNQVAMMPTRQSSSITSQMLMLSQSAAISSSPPQYATAAQYHSFATRAHTVNMTQPSPWKQQMADNFLASLPGTSQGTGSLISATSATSHLDGLLSSSVSSAFAPSTPSRAGVVQVTSSDPYMPQFLQSPSSSVVPSPNSMMAPSRSWWLDSPLTASVQSPLSISTPLPLTNQMGGTGPQTPLGQFLGGPATPPTLGRVNDVAENNLRPSFMSKMSQLTQRLEQPTIIDKSLKVFSALPSSSPHTSFGVKSEWADIASIARLRTASLSSDTGSMVGGTSTVPTTPSASWKVPQIDAATLYQHTAALTAAATPSLVLSPQTDALSSVPRTLQNKTTPIVKTPSPVASNIGSVGMSSLSVASPAKLQQIPKKQPVDTSPPQLTMRQISCDVSLLLSGNSNMTTDGNDSLGDLSKVELKEEPQLLSAPSSVKPSRGGGSRQQVQADSTLHPEERKRILHLHAEQNRRSALKDGFDQLMDMIPDLYSGGVKPTNAVVLAKAAEQIRRLQLTKQDQTRQKEEAKARIDRLNQKIISLQSNLPASSNTTASSSSQLNSKQQLENFYDRVMKEGGKKDWRFWVMCRMMQPLCVGQPNSFAATVASERCSREEVAASCSDWINNNWKATELRPLASTLLVHLATNTNILSNPESLQEHVAQQLKNPF